jgi:hypothetical protein
VLERFGEDETFFGWRMSDTLLQWFLRDRYVFMDFEQCDVFLLLMIPRLGRRA